MNWIDIVICIPLVWGFYKGFTKGLVVELATVVALGLGIWAALKFSELLSSFAKDHFGWNSKYLPVIAFCVILLGVLVLVYFIARMLTRAVKAASLGWLNKLAGATFGVMKFALLLSILFFVADAVEKSYPFISLEAKNGSLLYGPVSKIAPVLVPGLKESKITLLQDKTGSIRSASI